MDTDDPGDMVIPPGGTTGQVLAKNSASDYATAWQTPSLPGGAARPLLTGGAYLDGVNGLVLSGLTGNYASAPDSAALSITGDIDIKVLAILADWTPATMNTLISKYISSTLLSYGMNVLSDGKLQLFWSTNGSEITGYLSVNSTASVAVDDGAAKWVRATLDVNDGASQRVAKFYTSDDGTTWTQLGTTVTTAGTTSIFDGIAPLEVGRSVGPWNRSGPFIGSVSRVIVQSAYDTADNTTSVVFDANFATQTADALAFTESSSNAATVTINTTRYCYGLPNVQWSTSNATQALTANTVYYQPFLVNRPIIVNGTQFVVTTGPVGSTSNVRTGIYAADDNLQPTGAPVLDVGNTAVTASTTGTFFSQVTPVTLNPGVYLTAINASVALTARVVRGGLVGMDAGAGTNSIYSLMSGTQTQGAFPNPGTAWNTRTFSTTGPNHMLFLRWKAA